jgi:hypothetical protein
MWVKCYLANLLCQTNGVWPNGFRPIGFQPTDVAPTFIQKTFQDLTGFQNRGTGTAWSCTASISDRNQDTKHNQGTLTKGEDYVQLTSSLRYLVLYSQKEVI